ncbi:MAG: OmpW family outer membrane protein [Burkholderiaceae bacterium]|nr:OmpW family outer membrane protein [Burkholderiaceae bacterium]
MMTTKNLKKVAMALALAGSAAVPLAAQAQAQEGPWMVRVRALHLDSRNKDTTGLDLSINNRWIPELDISYFFTPNIAAELVLTYPQKQDLRAGGDHIGSLKHLPPTLLMQYHLTNFGDFKPYIGAGINFTRISNVHFSPAVKAALHPGLDNSSVGAAAQIGFDYKIAPNVYFNFDVKKVGLDTAVKSGTTKVGELKIDPWLIGVGIGYRF